MSQQPPQRILLTGFEPFGGEATNPSWEAVRMLDGMSIGSHLVVARCLPVTFGQSLQRLEALIRELDPALVVGVGQAGGRSQLSLERVAINVDDARIPDNAGACPIDQPVCVDGPAAYFSSLPIKAMREALHHAGIPAGISQTAGTYVCNHVFYGLMHAARDRPGMRGGFIHIPYSPQQAACHPGAASLAIDTAAEGLRIALTSAVSTSTDSRIAGGSEH